MPTAWATARPIGPGAEDEHAVVGPGRARATACQPTPSVSTRTSWSSVSPGSVKRCAAGTTMRSQQAAVLRDPEHVDAFAAVGPAPTAGATGPARDVRQHGTEVTGPNVGHTGPDREHLDRELVTEHARVDEEVLHPLVGMVVRAADANPTHRDEHLVGSGIGRIGMVDEEHAPRALQYCRLHRASCGVVGGRPAVRRSRWTGAPAARGPYWNWRN